MIETVWNTFGTISYFIEGYFFYRVIGGFLEQRENRILRLSAYIFGSMVCTIVIFPQDPVNLTLNLPFVFSYAGSWIPERYQSEFLLF